MKLKFELILAVFLCSGLSSKLTAQVPQDWTDGWHSWSVPAASNSEPKCCLHWRDGQVSKQRCDLESQGQSWSTDSNIPFSDLSVYVKVSQGVVKKIQSYSASCPIKTPQGLERHEVSANKSVKWLTPYIDDQRRLSDEALVALALHDHQNATKVLKRVALTHAKTGIRKQSIFWLGQTKASETKETILSLMFRDENAKIREHAAFSWSQTQLRNRDKQLIQLGQKDSSPHVRGQAWFWLAQTKLNSSEEALMQAIKTDSSRHVRHQAIFALGQLPEQRALKALTQVLQDRSLDLKDRKMAVFWLADLDSDEAIAYLDGLLK